MEVLVERIWMHCPIWWKVFKFVCLGLCLLDRCPKSSAGMLHDQVSYQHLATSIILNQLLWHQVRQIQTDSNGTCGPVWLWPAISLPLLLAKHSRKQSFGYGDHAPPDAPGFGGEHQQYPPETVSNTVKYISQNMTNPPKYKEIPTCQQSRD